MLDPLDAARLDQDAAFVAEHYPTLLWSLYQGLLGKGFEKDDAMAMTYQFFEFLLNQSGPEECAA